MNMKSYIKLVLVLFIFPFIISCEKNAVGVKLPSESKLVISSFISPDVDTIRVYVRESEPATGSTSIGRFGYYKDANVVLSDGNQSVQLIYIEERIVNVGLKGVYIALNTGSFKIDYGKTYYLEVTDPKGRKATASCTVPAKLNYVIEPQFELRDRTTDIIGTNGYDVYVSWNDIPDQTNYFRVKDLEVNYQFPYCFSFYGTKTCVDEKGNPLVAQQGHNVSFVNDIDFTDDTKNPNSVLTLKGSTFKLNYSYEKVDPKDVTTSFNYTFIQLDENYYQYMKSNSRYISADTPFVEPTLMYSNVEGGLGIFGSYTVLVDKSK